MQVMDGKLCKEQQMKKTRSLNERKEQRKHESSSVKVS
jgi:hypothetical protein